MYKPAGAQLVEYSESKGCKVVSCMPVYFWASMRRPQMVLIARIVFALPTPVMNM